MIPPQQARTAPRHPVPADWLARYHLEHHAEGRWRDANLLELSERGAKLELRGLALSDVLGPLELHVVTPLGSPDGVHLRGEIRRAVRTSRSRVRVGIQFVDSNENAAELLELLIQPH